MIVKSIKKIGNKYKIIFSDNSSMITYDDVILNNNILYKKDLSNELIEKISIQNKYYEAYNSVLKFLKIKLRSELEVREYLGKLDISFNQADDIVKRLKNSGLINTDLYVKAYVHDKFSFSNDGPNKIRKDLLLKNISNDIIDRELSSIGSDDLFEKLNRLVIKKVNSNSKYSNKMLRQKLLSYFINLGYDENDILYIIDNNLVDNNIIKKQYLILFNKYSSKYSSEQLKMVIKQKLYLKGFEIEDINRIMQ